MNKLKKLVLSVLLFTFAFISIHDYVMVDKQFGIKYEVSYFECEDTAIDLTSHLHDSLHTLLFTPLKGKPPITLVSSYQKQFQVKNLFISHIGSVPQRPPLS